MSTTETLTTSKGDAVKLTKGQQDEALANTLRPISEIGESFTDGSALFDPKVAEAEFLHFIDEAGPWVRNYREADGLTLAAALAETRLRSCVKLGDGTPDWSGGSHMWRKLIIPRIDAQLAAEHGFTPAELKDFRDAMGMSRARHGLTVQAIAEYKVRTVNGLGATKVKVNGTETTIAKLVEKAEKGTALPAELRKHVHADFKKQRTASGSPRRGFEKLPTTFGPIAKDGPSKKDPAKVTPSVMWEKLRSEAKAGKLAPLTVAEETHKLATSIAVGLIGEAGKPAPAKVPERAKVADELLATAELLTRLAHNLKGVSGASKEKVGEMYWQDKG